jgi:hypothetical protein
MAFFHIDWHDEPGKPFQPIISQQTPEHTGFDWPAWIGRGHESEKPVATARLADRLE